LLVVNIAERINPHMLDCKKFLRFAMVMKIAVQIKIIV